MVSGEHKLPTHNCSPWEYTNGLGTRLGNRGTCPDVLPVQRVWFQDSGKETVPGPTVTCDSAGKIVQPTHSISMQTGTFAVSRTQCIYGRLFSTGHI